MFLYLSPSHHRKHNVTYMRRHVFITRPITCRRSKNICSVYMIPKTRVFQVGVLSDKIPMSLVKRIGILACTNPRMLVPFRHESRFSVAKSLAIYFNTLERKFSRAFLCVGNTSGWRPNAASADVQSLASYNLRKLISAKIFPWHTFECLTFSRIVVSCSIF